MIDQYNEFIRQNPRFLNGLFVSQTQNELFSLYQFVKGCNETKGSMAEVGVLHGGTAKFISLLKNYDTKLFLFDTFNGLQDVCPIDLESFPDLKNGLIADKDIDSVKGLFLNDETVIIEKGYFPQDTHHKVDNEKFSFVHLDVDTFLSTYNCLNYFHEKMLKNSMILCHDYQAPHLIGVKKAVDKFCQEKKKTVNLLSDSTQCFITYA